jgi:hypothetical protein
MSHFSGFGRALLGQFVMYFEIRSRLNTAMQATLQSRITCFSICYPSVESLKYADIYIYIYMLLVLSVYLESLFTNVDIKKYGNGFGELGDEEDIGAKGRK